VPGKFKNNTKSSATNLDLMLTLRSFGPSSTVLVGRVSPGRVVHRTWHEPTRSAARGTETGCAPGRFENNSKSSATSLDLIPTLRSFGPSSTIEVGRISPGRVLALHVLPVCAYSAPACVYLAFVCVFASLLVLADTVHLRQRLVLARVPCARMPCSCLRVPLLCLRVCFCACVFSALGLFLNCSYDHWGGTPPLNHGRAASTLTIGAPQRLLWLISFSPLASVCTAETVHPAYHPHNTPTCNCPPPHTHTLHTACQRP